MDKFLTGRMLAGMGVRDFCSAEKLMKVAEVKNPEKFGMNWWKNLGTKSSQASW